jgi:secreted trypsin-like serine protease
MIVILLSIFLQVSSTVCQNYCGKVSVPTGLVVYGEETLPGEFPFLVALYKFENDKFFCAGSLITRRHVLSGE